MTSDHGSAPGEADLDDPAFVQRFVAAYAGRHDALDALFWLRHPDSEAPSGAESPAAVLRTARAAVYRRDAGEDDRRRVQALASAIAGDEEATRAAIARATVPPSIGAADAGLPTSQFEPPVPATRPQRARAAVIAGGAVAAAVALIGGGIALSGGSGATPRATPSVQSTPIPYLGGPAAVSRSRADLAALFDHPQDAFLGLFLAQHRTALSSSIRTNSIAKDATAVGPHMFSLAGIQNDQPTGLLTVLLTCSRSAPYSWDLIAPGAKPVHVRGAECHGHVVSATFVPEPHHVPTGLRVVVPRGVRVLVEADLSRY